VEVEKDGSIHYCGSGVIRPQSQQLFPQRLWKIFCDLRQQIEIFRPHLMGVERPFYGKNVQSAMMLGQARGVAVLAGAEAGLMVQEYSPLEVKQSVVGYGRAAKEQVQSMVQALLRTSTKMAADAADALAVAICAAHSATWQRCLDGSTEEARGDQASCRRGSRKGPVGVDE
jgi:crossover junction endodeoxyribonuclease RuvC